MHKLYFDSALTPDGWQDAVTVEIAEGRVATVEVGADPRDPTLNERGGIAVS